MKSRSRCSLPVRQSKSSVPKSLGLLSTCQVSYLLRLPNGLDRLHFFLVGGARSDRHLWGFSASWTGEVSSKSSQTWAVWGGCCAALHRSTDPTFRPRSGPSHPRCWCAPCAQAGLRRRRAPVLATGLKPTQRRPSLIDVTFSVQEGVAGPPPR